MTIKLDNDEEYDIFVTDVLGTTDPFERYSEECEDEIADIMLMIEALKGDLEDKLHQDSRDFADYVLEMEYQFATCKIYTITTEYEGEIEATIYKTKMLSQVLNLVLEAIKSNYDTRVEAWQERMGKVKKTAAHITYFKQPNNKGLALPYGTMKIPIKGEGELIEAINESFPLQIKTMGELYRINGTAFREALERFYPEEYQEWQELIDYSEYYGNKVVLDWRNKS